MGEDMSETIDAGVSALNDRLGGGFDGTAMFVVEDEGTILVDEAGARAADGAGQQAEVTMTTDADTFRAILGGEMNPTAAFMSGQLKIDGDMGTAMKLGTALS